MKEREAGRGKPAQGCTQLKYYQAPRSIPISVQHLKCGATADMMDAGAPYALSSMASFFRYHLKQQGGFHAGEENRLIDSYMPIMNVRVFQ